MFSSSKMSADDLANLTFGYGPSPQQSSERDLRMDEASGLMEFYRVGSGEAGFDDLVPEIGDDAAGVLRPKTKHPGLNAIFAAFYRMFLFADDLADHRRLSQQASDLTAMPYWKAAPAWKTFADQFRRYQKVGILTRLLMPAIDAWAKLAARADAQRQALRLGLAAETYRARHGNFPTQLSDLVPDFIPAIPSDPFDGKPMKMKRTEHGLIFYSIGPDMVDNGGTPFDPGTGTGDITFELSEAKP